MAGAQGSRASATAIHAATSCGDYGGQRQASARGRLWPPASLVAASHLRRRGLPAVPETVAHEGVLGRLWRQRRGRLLVVPQCRSQQAAPCGDGPPALPRGSCGDARLSPAAHQDGAEQAVLSGILGVAAGRRRLLSPVEDASIQVILRPHVPAPRRQPLLRQAPSESTPLMDSLSTTGAMPSAARRTVSPDHLRSNPCHVANWRPDVPPSGGAG
mmetsp:Transcript_29870/g.80899  ORF Transcript_29870/g.80899 Transcript_29870/m.80899 type:complete len:215 (-) Transcript_29870:446-1090(-)